MASRACTVIYTLFCLYFVKLSKLLAADVLYTDIIGDLLLILSSGDMRVIMGWGFSVQWQEATWYIKNDHTAKHKSAVFLLHNSRVLQNNYYRTYPIF